MTSEPIAVFGMHRCGTSVVAHALEILGLDLRLIGDAEVRAAPSNPKGHFENTYMMDISDTILKELGGAWDIPMMLKKSFVDSPRIDYMLTGAPAVIKQQFPGRVVWKDPRVSLTLPFFERILGRVTSIICVRNPLEVCNSLMKRDGMDIRQASALWRAYISSALINTEHHKRLILHYDDVIFDPIQAIWSIRDFLGMPDVNMKDAARDFTTFVEDDLRRNRSTIEDLYTTPGMDQRAVLLYTLLRQTSIDTVVRIVTPELACSEK